MTLPRHPLLRLLLPLLLGMILLSIQQVTASHAVQHALAHQQEQSLPASHHCDLCALDVQLGSALHSAAPVLLLANTESPRPAPVASNWLSSTPQRARARGPPILG